MSVNLKLAEKQGLTEDDVVEIEKLHHRLNAIIANPYKFEKPVETIEQIEFSLQLLWKFPVDKNYHRYWIFISGCVCPQSDNMSRVGTPYRIFNNSCKWHGTNRK